MVAREEGALEHTHGREMLGGGTEASPREREEPALMCDRQDGVQEEQ